MNCFRIILGLVVLFVFNILLIHGKDVKADFTTSATPTTTLQRTTVAEGINSATAKEGLTKRDTKAADQTSANTVAAKSYDPPPEFYRGPGSTGPLHSVTTPYYSANNNYNKLSSGFVSKPIAFPDTNINTNNNNNNHYSPPDNGAHLASSYNSWQHLKNKTALFGALLNKTGLQDRISVGHYGNPLHDSRPYSGTQHQVDYIPSGGHHYMPSHTGGGSGGYAYDSRPYTVTPHVDYGHQFGSAHTGGTYYGGGGSAVGEGLPFDVYGGSGGGGGGGGGKGHYAGTGGDYAYTYSDMHDSAVHKTFPDLSQKALLAKSFLIPLASAAVLGIAAALVSNPLLLQLGTVSGIGPGSVLGKRKRREAPSPTPHDKQANVSTASSKDTVTHPYRGHHRRFVRT